MRSIYKKWAVAAVFVPFVCAAGAAVDTDKFVITTKNGDHIQLHMTDVGRVSFGDNILNLHMSDGTMRTLSLSSVDNLSFDLQVPTGIDRLETDLGDDVMVKIADGIVTLTQQGGSALEVAVYGINGTLVYVACNRDCVEIDFKTLAGGVYIIRANGKTIKYVN
ncbi:MAG: hypothetical protein K2M76_01530 [Muribaculaceae bacterium]|nr:hypothetical protein [Muribaculaceae bacterium]